MTKINEKLFSGATHQTALAILHKKIRPGEKRPIVKVPTDQLPLPSKLRAHEVLVMVHSCQICDTDIELGSNPGHGAATTGFKRGNTGLILNGHEAGGVIIARGKKVTRVEEGDWVSLKVREGMQSTECIACQADMSHRCRDWQYEPADMVEHGIFRAPGWFCEYSVLHERQVITLPKGLDPEFACMGEPLSIGANALMTAVERWWSAPGFLEETRKGPPAIAVIGAGGIASIDAPVFSEWPQNILEAMRTGALPDNYLDRPYAETRRKAAGLKRKKPAKAEVFYYARTPYKKGLLKADVVKPLGIHYHSFEDMGLPYIEVVTPAAKKGERDRVQKVYNLTPLMNHPTKKRFDLVIEMCTNPLQVARMMLPPSDPGQVEDFLGRSLAKSREQSRRCEGRYVNPPGTPSQMRAFAKTPEAGSGGLMAPGTKLIITSITGGDEVYPNLEVAKFCWAACLNNAEMSGIVNYDEYHTRVGLLSLAQVCRKKGLKDWPRRIQERVVEHPDEMLGEGMYDLKASVSGRVAIIMNPKSKIRKALKVAKGKSKKK